MAGALNNWSLNLVKDLTRTVLGDPVADNTPVNFRIFTMDPTNPLSSNTWTSVGPASIGSNTGTGSGRLSAIAVDPSDPSGNTVFVAGASGGVWKTTNFLTSSSQGPTYTPLTDFGTTFATNIGSLVTFGRNSDPRQSIVFAGTGEGPTGSAGVGFLRSMDGGASWLVLDSSVNYDAAGNLLPLNSPARDHVFVGTQVFQLVADPRLTPTGEVILYAAVSGPTAKAGIWRSTDTGRNWVRVRGGQATDVVLDLNSGPVDAFGNTIGNLRILYAAFRGEGVFISPNQGNVWNQLNGGVGKPFLVDGDVAIPPPIPVNNPSSTPNGAKGRISLARPELTGNPLQDLLYQGWLYALVATPGSSFEGLYLTKDFGQNWTKIHLPTLPPIQNVPRAVPSNNPNLEDYDIGGSINPQLNYDQDLVIDPTNPNVVYVGGKRDLQSQPNLIRVDVSTLSDPHAFYTDLDNPDGGDITALTTDPLTIKDPTRILGGNDPRNVAYINLYQNPFSPFSANQTFVARNTSRVANTGSDARWIYFNAVTAGSNDIQRMISIRDPLTGKARLIFGDDHGIYTGVDRGDGVLITGIGNSPIATFSRNGNLGITQFYYGATQPSSLAAQLAGALFYGNAQDDGAPRSTADVLNTGNLRWFDVGGGLGRGDGTGVELPQVDDSGGIDQFGQPNNPASIFGGSYDYRWPCCGGNVAEFLKFTQPGLPPYFNPGFGRTTGLIQKSNAGCGPRSPVALPGPRLWRRDHSGQLHPEPGQ